MAHFVLDHNFPEIVTTVKWPPSIELSQLKALDSRLISGLEDWQVLLALHQRGGIDAFVTQDVRILSSPTEVTILCQLSLSLVVVEGVAENPIRATGVLMAHLEPIVSKLGEGTRIFRLRVNRVDDTPNKYLNQVALQQRISPPDLAKRENAIIGDLSAPVVEPLIR